MRKLRTDIGQQIIKKGDIKMISLAKKDKIKSVIIGVLSAGLLLSVGTIFMKDANESSYELTTSKYEIAEVADDGDLVKDGTSSLVSGFVRADDLKVEMSQNSVVSYKIHYYDEDKEWISSTTEQTSDYTGETPEKAEYARVEITPLNDNYISAFEKAEYANQIKVTVEKVRK